MKQAVLALEDIFNVMPDSIVVIRTTGVIEFVNSATEHLLGYTPGELPGKPLDCLIPREYRSTHAKHVRRFLDHGQPTAMGARPLLSALHKSGEQIPISISIANLDLDGQRYSVAVMRDSRELDDQIRQVTAMATTDKLTGIGNRLRFEQAIRVALDKAPSFGLLFLDLKEFKPFNDNYGHDVGDRVLQIVARRLQSHIRGGDIAARLGGDEFVVLLEGLDQPSMLEQRAAALVRSLTRRFVIGDLSANVGVNIGGAIYPRDGDSMEALITAADQNMYRAKRADVAYRVG